MFSPRISSLMLIILISLNLIACKDDHKNENNKNAEKPATEKPSTTDAIATNPILEKATDWTKNFTLFYPHIQTCIKTTSPEISGPIVKILHAEINQTKDISIIMEEEKGSAHECKIKTTIDALPEIVPAQSPPPTTTHFYIRQGAQNAPEILPPPDSCLNNITVKNRSGQVLGWLSVPICAENNPL